MSRRETRDSDSRHHRSRSDREPSPKRVRRDGKPATERPTNFDSAEHVDRDQKHHRRLQDSLPLEAPVPYPKVGTVHTSKESDKKSNGYCEGTKNSSENIEAPQIRSHFQHDERAGQVGRSVRARGTTERGWWKDSKDRQTRRATNRTSNNDDTKPRDEKTHAQGADHRVWLHNSPYKTEPDSKPSSKKRPSFRETKAPTNEKTAAKAAPEATKPPEKPPVVERSDRRLFGERDPHRTEPQRMKFQSRDRYGGNGGYRGRDRFSGRQVQGGGRVERWKHDLYDEGNKSPSSKKEEEQIAKVEALLAS